MNDESMRERFEAWLKSRNGDPMFWNTSDAMFAAWQAATLAERERAAKVCEQLDDDGEGPDCWGWLAKDYSKAIRKCES